MNPFFQLMSKSFAKSMWLELQIDPADPQLLDHLDRLLQAGMLQPEQILQIAKVCLSENLIIAPSNIQTVVKEPLAPKVQAPTPATPTIWQTLRDELSLRWLLFLGVFLVVLSSGVLAATQWSRFPAWGQYGLLWLYTIGFWITGRWSQRQQGLKLTANTLQLVALLLVPVNFWAIDSFGLWHQPWEIATTAFSSAVPKVIATISLAGITYLSIPHPTTAARWLMCTYIALSTLQLGWQIPHWAAITIYIGSIGLAIVLQKTKQISPGKLAIFGLGVLLLRGLFVAHLPFTSFALAIGILGWLFAQWAIQQQQQLMRVKSIIQNSPSRRLLKHQETLNGLISLYNRLGAGLLTLGWALGLSEWYTSPWQSMAVNGLALIWIWQRLQRDGKERDLVALFLVGLQTYFLSSFLWQFISTGVLLAKILPTIKHLFGENYLFAGSLLIFPYLLLWVWITAWFWKREQRSLCRTGETLMLTTGVVATLFSGGSPLGLLIDLVASTAILFHITHRYPPLRSGSVYLTHLCGLLTIVAAVNYRWDWCKSIANNIFFPNNSLISNDDLLISFVIGSAVLAMVAAIELCFSARASQPEDDHWLQSAWDYGRISTMLAYCGFAIVMIACNVAAGIWPVFWLIIPAAFTHLSHRQPRVILPWQQVAQSQAGWWAIGGLLTAVLLSIQAMSWLNGILIVGLGMMTLLVRSMVRNVDLIITDTYDQEDIDSRPYYVNQSAIAAATIQIGFGLLLGIHLSYGKIANPLWLIIGAVICSGLWFISKRLHLRSYAPLSEVYGVAADLWAIGLAILGIAIGAGNYCLRDFPWLATPFTIFIDPQQISNLASPTLSRNWLISSLILLWAMQQRQRWLNIGIAIPTWIWTTISFITAEISLGAGVHLAGGNTLALAIVNIALALLLWIWQFYQQKRSINQTLWLFGASSMPIWLAAWGLILRLPYFNSYSGGLSIAIGIICILSSRNYHQKFIAYSGMSLVTLGCYELVTYQISQAPAGGNVVDAFTIYGFVTAVLALIYRLGVWFKARQQQEYWWDLPLSSIKNVAHAHWAIASVWKVSAAVMPVIPIPQFTLLHLAISGLLGIYALIQGRDREHSDWWVYLGLAELMGVGIYARSIFQHLSIVDNSLVTLACLLGILLLLAPWGAWGWDYRPWRRVALILPLTRVVFEWQDISILNLLVLAIFYGGVARRQQHFGWAYLSLLFLNWSGLRLLWENHLTSPIWYALLVGLSILIAVQWDPAWRKSRYYRHYGRLGGTGIISVTAIVWHQPWLPVILGLAIATAGLLLRVRAWLYVGTTTFLLTTGYQLIILITEQPVTKWAIGLATGMLIILLAANFERRREQITQALQHWLDQLQDWQ
jgi:hypothetical protein